MISIKNKIHKIFNPLLINHETYFDDGSTVVLLIMYRAWLSILKELPGRQKYFLARMPINHCLDLLKDQY